MRTAVWSDLPDRHSDLSIQGFSLIGLLSTLTLFGVAGLLVIRVGPSVIEYWAIEKAVRAASAVSATPSEMRAAYDKLASVAYIDAVQGKDLLIEGSGDAMKVRFAYEKRIPLSGPASLVIAYRGPTDSDVADQHPK
ncbi:MAG: hypothetical protein RL001_2331 [Pseudomonadota bacterium]|jgi:Domain of unknown function (DUF4845)|nr:DUF4845 domain-containing protein [Oxalobacteraceae bacterium]